MPSKVFKRSKAAVPLEVLWGIMPRTVRQKILEGARKWNGPVSVCQPNVHNAKNVCQKRTTASWVKASLLAHERLVLYYCPNR